MVGRSVRTRVRRDVIVVVAVLEEEGVSGFEPRRRRGPEARAEAGEEPRGGTALPAAQAGAHRAPGDEGRPPEGTERLPRTHGHRTARPDRVAPATDRHPRQQRLPHHPAAFHSDDETPAPRLNHHQPSPFPSFLPTRLPTYLPFHSHPGFATVGHPAKTDAS